MLAPFMQSALDQAHLAQSMDEVPVGAIIIHQGKIIAAAGNRVITNKDATAHAEILAIREACALLRTTYLTDCTLIVTLEPCAMCAAAISLAKIRCLVFGAYDPKSGGVDHGARFFEQSTCHHRPEIIGGVLEKDCAYLLTQFFSSKRF